MADQLRDLLTRIVSRERHRGTVLLDAEDLCAIETALAQAEPDHETRAELAEQQVVQLAEERDHYRRLWQKAQQAEPVQSEYGSIDCVTFAGLPMTDGDRRLAAMLTQAFGADHPAIHDLVALLFAARGKQRAEPVQFDPAEAMRLADEYASAQSELDGEHSVNRLYYVKSRNDARAKLAAYLGIKGGGNG